MDSFLYVIGNVFSLLVAYKEVQNMLHHSRLAHLVASTVIM